MCGDADEVHFTNSIHRTQSPPGFVLDLQAKRRDSCTAEAHRRELWWDDFCGKHTSCASASIRTGESFRRFPWLCLYCLHMQRLVTARGRSILCAFPCLWCVSVQRGSSLCAHQTPHYRTYPQLCAQSRPFACILTRPNYKQRKTTTTTTM